MPRPLLIFFALLGVALVVRAGPRDRGVIIDHLEFGSRVMAGENPYAEFVTERRNKGPLHTPYPPSFGVFTAPFSMLPARLARFAWATLQVAALGFLGWCLVQLARRGRSPPSWPTHWVLVGVFAVLSRYILRDTHGGGGNGINSALAFGGLALAELARAAKDPDGAAPKGSNAYAAWGGILLGVSIATKPTQLLLLGLMLLLGHRRAAAWAVGAAAAMVAAAWLQVGTDPWVHWAEGSLAYGAVTDIYAPPSHGFPPFTWMNQCLRCALYRVLGTVPSPFADEIAGFSQGLGMPLATVALIAKATSVAMLAASLGLIWRGRHTARGRLYGAALLMVLSLLMSPISWKAHHVALAPAFFALLAFGDKRTWWGLALYLPSCAVGEEFLGSDLKNRLQSLYIVTVWDIVLWVLLALRLWREERPR